MLVPECRVMGSCHSERNYGPGWPEVGAVVGKVPKADICVFREALILSLFCC